MLILYFGFVNDIRLKTITKWVVKRNQRERKMNNELQQKLYDKYPKIFAQAGWDKKHTAMCWGIAVKDGWYNIIDVLCMQIQNYLDKPIQTVAYIDDEIQKPENSSQARQELSLIHI